MNHSQDDPVLEEATRRLVEENDVIVTTSARFDRMRILAASLEHEVATEGLLLYG